MLTFFLLLFLGIVLLMGGIAEIDTTAMIVTSINGVISLLSIIPMIAMTVRRLRDAGYSVKSFLWLLIPVIGWIAFIARLFGKSVAEIEAENVM